jgi:putative transposase
VLRSYRYRLYPTKAQARRLSTWLDLTRELYNAALQERRDAWKKQRVSVSKYDQMRVLPNVREARPEFADAPIVVLRGALKRLDGAFKDFFRRCKSGKKPGFPRFKSASRWNSIMIDDLKRDNPVVAGGKRVAIPLLGKVKFKQHRPIEGTPKAIKLTLDAAGHWYVTFACIDVPTKPLAKTGRDVGIDLGIENFIATSDGDLIPNERPGTKAARSLAKAQRRVSRRKKGSRRCRQAARLLARVHARVANTRQECHIVVAKALVDLYDTIYVEKLNIQGLARGHLAKSVYDVAWGNFLHWLHVKAEEAGREVIEVDPRGTSQECPNCGQIVKKLLSQREHRCDCGLICHRDVAAAIIVRDRGRRSQGGAAVVDALRRSAKPKSASDLSTHLAGVL